MKVALVLLVAIFCARAAKSESVNEQIVADPAPLKMQKDFLLILENINQVSFYEEFVQIGNSYKISENAANYTNQSAVQDFLQYYNYGLLLPRGQIFSVFYKEHLQQAIALFRLLFYANNYDVFYKTAVWARQNVNEGLFLYSFVVAVIHRPDTKYPVLPPIYEVYPYYFVSAEIIQQAHIYKQLYQGQSVQTDGYNGYTIDTNYSGYYLTLNEEESLSYYLEDVGISSYYYYYNAYYPFWMSSEEFGFQNVNRGEQYYFLNQQLLARYYLERLANGLGEIPFFDWNVPVQTPFYPSLEYPNGQEFSSRPAYANLYKYFYNYGQNWASRSKYGNSYSLVQNYERRISDAIDSGYIYTPNGGVSLYSEEGLNVLGNLIQGNADSPNYKYYGAVWLYGSHLLGYSYQPWNKIKIAPSALEQFETALRDPAFYQLYNRIFLEFQKYFYNLEAYSAKELVYQGVKITKFSSDDLITYNDPFYINISNAVYYSPQEQQNNNFNVRVRQYRLNNRPFTYKITVQADKQAKSVVKVFFGPKYDEYGRYINISQNRLNFFLLDYFLYNLNAGENIISRNSYESTLFVPDATSYLDLYKQVLGASGGQQSFSYGKQYYFYLPQRYILPRGSAEGTPYQFYVIVYPYQAKSNPLGQEFESYYYPFEGESQFYDSYSLGYPFDRFINNEQFFYNVQNSYFYEAKVYYRENIDAVPPK